MTRSNLRNAASTLAHHWAVAPEGSLSANRLGVERLLLAYDPEVRCALCVAIAHTLHTRHGAHHADAFEDMLYDASVIS